MGIFDMIGSWMNPGKGYKEAGKELTKGWNQSQQFQKPYWQAGLDQMGNLTGAQNELMEPQALQNKWAEGYEKSPYAKQLQKEASAGGMDAAASMGLGGSSAALGNIQQSSANIMNADRQQYMNDLMQKYMSGVGIGQNMYGIGAGMGQSLGQGAMNYGEGMGQSKFGQYNAGGQNFSDLLNMIGKGASSYFGGR